MQLTFTLWNTSCMEVEVLFITKHFFLQKTLRNFRSLRQNSCLEALVMYAHGNTFHQSWASLNPTC